MVKQKKSANSSKMKPEPLTTRRSSWTLIVLVALVLLAFVLRLHNLGTSSLRGDEAFAIRYWAQSPATVLQTLAGTEPHPLGTFTLFWAWKNLIGDSEFAMRMLPLLGNLIGVAAIAALGRRLFKSWAVGLVAALLWAMNPNLIWHSQDARDYAIWAGISVLNLWLLLRATERSRRIDWALYILSTTLGLYIFFLEIIIFVVHGLYVAIFRRKLLRRWLGALLVIGVLLIPWLAQDWVLAHSGYSGTATRADLGALWTQFFPTFWLGEAGNIGSSTLQSLLAIIFLGTFAFTCFHARRVAIFSALLLVIPTLLLTIIVARLNLFIPHYLIAVTPALLLPVAYTTVSLWTTTRSRDQLIAALALGLLIGVSAATLVSYFTVYQKASNWRALGELLRTSTTARDTVIFVASDPSGSTDPAFGYYYHGPASVQALPRPDTDTPTAVSQALASDQTVYLIPVGAESTAVICALRSAGMHIGEESVDSFHIQIYRAKAVQPDEIAVPLNLAFGSAKLRGYSLLGTSKSGSPLFVLLFWQVPPPQNLKVFVHLIGSAKTDGSSLWAQDDHPAQPGRDPYRLDLTGVTPGGYTLEMGVYDPTNGQRVSITNSDSGTALGDSTQLQHIAITP